MPETGWYPTTTTVPGPLIAAPTHLSCSEDGHTALVPGPDDHPSASRRLRTMQPLAAVTRLAAAAPLGAVLGLVVGVLTDPLLGLLAAIAGTGALFVVTGWIVLWPIDADRTRDTVQREDFRPVGMELV